MFGRFDVASAVIDPILVERKAVNILDFKKPLLS